MTGGKAALLGMMASGKSTVGARLSELSGIPFLDVDAALEIRAGLTIPDCFARFGEAGFRRLELETLRDCLARPGPLVLALGGGAYMQEEVRRELRAGAAAIYIRLSAAELVRRLEKTDISARPMLAAVPDWRERAKELTEARDPVYLEADLVIEADGLTVDDLAEKIADILSRRPGFSPGSAEIGTGRKQA